MSSCSDADKKTLNNAADCEENTEVCNNGQVVNGLSALGCAAQEAGVSNTCAQALSNN